MNVFTTLIAADKNESQATADYGLGPSIDVNIRRTHLYEDAFDKLSPQNGKYEIILSPYLFNYYDFRIKSEVKNANHSSQRRWIK